VSTTEGVSGSRYSVTMRSICSRSARSADMRFCLFGPTGDSGRAAAAADAALASGFFALTVIVVLGLGASSSSSGAGASSSEPACASSEPACASSEAMFSMWYALPLYTSSSSSSSGAAAHAGARLAAAMPSCAEAVMRRILPCTMGAPPTML